MRLLHLEFSLYRFVCDVTIFTGLFSEDEDGRRIPDTASFSCTWCPLSRSQQATANPVSLQQSGSTIESYFKSLGGDMALTFATTQYEMQINSEREVATFQLRPSHYSGGDIPVIAKGTLDPLPYLGRPRKTYAIKLRDASGQVIGKLLFALVVREVDEREFERPPPGAVKARTRRCESALPPRRRDHSPSSAFHEDGHALFSLFSPSKGAAAVASPSSLAVPEGNSAFVGHSAPPVSTSSASTHPGVPSTLKTSQLPLTADSSRGGGASSHTQPLRRPSDRIVESITLRLENIFVKPESIDLHNPAPLLLSGEYYIKLRYGSFSFYTTPCQCRNPKAIELGNQQTCVSLLTNGDDEKLRFSLWEANKQVAGFSLVPAKFKVELNTWKEYSIPFRYYPTHQTATLDISVRRTQMTRPTVVMTVPVAVASAAPAASSPDGGANEDNAYRSPDLEVSLLLGKNAQASGAGSGIGGSNSSGGAFKATGSHVESSAVKRPVDYVRTAVAAPPPNSFGGAHGPSSVLRPPPSVAAAMSNSAASAPMTRTPRESSLSSAAPPAAGAANIGNAGTIGTDHTGTDHYTKEDSPPPRPIHAYSQYQQKHRHMHGQDVLQQQQQQQFQTTLPVGGKTVAAAASPAKGNIAITSVFARPASPPQQQLKRSASSEKQRGQELRVTEVILTPRTAAPAPLYSGSTASLSTAAALPHSLSLNNSSPIVRQRAATPGLEVPTLIPVRASSQHKEHAPSSALGLPAEPQTSKLSTSSHTTPLRSYLRGDSPIRQRQHPQQQQQRGSSVDSRFRRSDGGVGQSAQAPGEAERYLADVMARLDQQRKKMAASRTSAGGSSLVEEWLGWHGSRSASVASGRSTPCRADSEYSREDSIASIVSRRAASPLPTKSIADASTQRPFQTDFTAPPRPSIAATRPGGASIPGTASSEAAPPRWQQKFSTA